MRVTGTASSLGDHLPIRTDDSTIPSDAIDACFTCGNVCQWKCRLESSLDSFGTPSQTLLEVSRFNNVREAFLCLNDFFSVETGERSVVLVNALNGNPVDRSPGGVCKRCPPCNVG